jgi:murein DD-endopeptidase MepM/ murein hydrolase activator NlpD
VRSDVGELETLRAETGRQREQIRDFTQKVDKLDVQLARLTEFERKVRVIANLPGAVVEAEVGAVPAGVGGGEDEENSLVRDELVPAAAQGSRAARPRAVPLAGPGWHEELGAEAGRLLQAAEIRERSFVELVEQLRGKSERLASTPSVWPARGWLTSGFGRRVSPFTGKPHLHLGIDIAAARGTGILAPARGRVAFVGMRGALGRTLEIDHGFGVTTIYGHCDAIHVKPGQHVERGQWVAAIGNSGRSTGPHLHYGIKVGGRAVDPRHYILD